MKSKGVPATLVLLLIVSSGGPSLALEASGTVFEDQNRDGVQDRQERGLKGVRVSNGREIVLTDEKGRYVLPVGEDTPLFVIKPRGWMTPVDGNGLPRFYYMHKPKGSPEFRHEGLPPTGPLPDSVDFPLVPQEEPERFRVVLFGDTQSSNEWEIHFMAHDVVEELIGVEAAFGVTLGDIVNDDLSLFAAHNRVIAQMSLPWYNVIGNHDQNYDAPNDELADEAFERVYGPSYYSFDYASVHFVVLDDAYWQGPVQDPERWPGGNYIGGLGERQLAWLTRDLALVPADRLVVLMMHIPFSARWIETERAAIYRLLAAQPRSVSISAHYHTLQHLFLDAEDGWPGAKPHHHYVAPTVCGSWWSGAPDESGIPHATMSDGCPNGYSFVEFDGADYEIVYKAARRPAAYQMNIISPDLVTREQIAGAEILVNVFAGSERSRVEYRLGEKGDWMLMEQVRRPDPFYLWQKELEKSATPPPGARLPAASESTHIWEGSLPPQSPPGTHLVQVRSTDLFGHEYRASRVIRIR